MFIKQLKRGERLGDGLVVLITGCEVQHVFINNSSLKHSHAFSDYTLPFFFYATLAY